MIATPVPVTLSGRPAAGALSPVETAARAALSDLSPRELPSRDAARAAYAAARRLSAPDLLPYSFTRLLTVGDENAKLGKGRGRLIVALSLSPHRLAQVGNVCPWSTVACRWGCVAHSGNGGIGNVRQARDARTRLLVDAPDALLALLLGELGDLSRSRRIACRLNAFADVRWERVLPPWVWERLRGVAFYDYTKAPLAARPVDSLPSNYRLTYSYRGDAVDGPAVAWAHLSAGRNVAAVVPVRGGHDRRTGRLRPIPRSLWGAPVIDGDRDDRRYRDPAGHVVILRRKGTMSATSAMLAHGGEL